MEKNKTNFWLGGILLVFFGLALRLYFCNGHLAFESDLNTFKYWSSMLFEGGLSNFYTQDVFTDYPPGYMWVLYLVGGLRHAFGLSMNSPGFTAMIQTPAMVCDLITGVFIFKVACDHGHLKLQWAWLLAFAYVFCPPVVLNSAIWGQVDSVYTLLLLLAVYFVVENKKRASYLLFTLAVLVKPQALMLTPIFLYDAFYGVFNAANRLSAFKKLCVDGFICLLVFTVLILPFTKGFNLAPIIHQYRETLTSYPYATVNAYNLYALLGANWVDISRPFLFFTYGTWGMIFINGIVLLSIFLLERNHSKANFYFVSALIFILTFNFSVKMHERYVFPALVFLLFAFIYSNRKALLFFYAGLAGTLFVNCADVLKAAYNGYDYTLLARNMPTISFLNVLLACLSIAGAFVLFSRGVQVREKPVKQRPAKAISIEKGQDGPSMTKRDWLLCGGLMVVYACIAFYNLGDKAAPESGWRPGQGQDAIIDFGQVTPVTHMTFMTGEAIGDTFALSISPDGENWQYVETGETASVFAWKNLPFEGEGRYVKVTPLTNNLSLLEMGFIYEEKVLPVLAVSTGGEGLTDEQRLVPLRPSYRNSTYFDEIYHARTAYEFIHHLPVFEWTHPPLGKVIISWGIMLFGMNPFGYRFMGTLAGILMLLPMYALGKRLFKSTFFAFFAAFLLAFDFMHFAQTRIATIDSYITLFILCMTYFMVVYITEAQQASDKPFWHRLTPLLASGAFMGLAIASKWPGVYGAAGLAVLFFWALYRQLVSGALKPKEAWQTCGFCVLAFVVLPLCIYALSYIPYLQTPGKQGLASILDNQTAMFNYHSTLKEGHPFASGWWSWMLNLRPIFYYAGSLGYNIYEGISAFGNPAIWWPGILALFYCLYRAWKWHDDHTAIILLIAFGAQLLPWVLVTRVTFIYHYFPCVPFLIAMVCYGLQQVVWPVSKRAVWAYGAVVLALFVLFYPVLSGMPILRDWVQWLRWLPSWQLI